MNDFWKNKKVLITGASGFVGSNACVFYANLGCKVTGIVSPTTNKKKKKINLAGIGKPVRLKKANLLSAADVLEITKDQDVILHFAGIDGGLQYKKLHSADIFSHNMRINLNILEASAINKVKNLLMISSADIYTLGKQKFITEETPIEIDLKNDIDGYKLAKWTTELAIREYTRQFSMNYVIVRPSNLYGPRDEFENIERLRFIPAIIKNILQKKPITLFGNGKQLRSFLFVEDFLSITAKLIENQIHNLPINVASEREISLENIASLIMTIIGSKVPIIVDDKKPSGTNMHGFDLSLLRDKIGTYPETDFEDGLKKTILFYKRNYF